MTTRNICFLGEIRQIFSGAQCISNFVPQRISNLGAKNQYWNAFQLLFSQVK